MDSQPANPPESNPRPPPSRSPSPPLPSHTLLQTIKSHLLTPLALLLLLPLALEILLPYFEHRHFHLLSSHKYKYPQVEMPDTIPLYILISLFSLPVLAFLGHIDSFINIPVGLIVCVLFSQGCVRLWKEEDRWEVRGEGERELVRFDVLCCLIMCMVLTLWALGTLKRSPNANSGIAVDVSRESKNAKEKEVEVWKEADVREEAPQIPILECKQEMQPQVAEGTFNSHFNFNVESPKQETTRSLQVQIEDEEQNSREGEDLYQDRYNFDNGRDRDRDMDLRFGGFRSRYDDEGEEEEGAEERERRQLLKGKFVVRD